MPPRKDPPHNDSEKGPTFRVARSNLTANLRRLRKGAGLSQAELAERANLSLVYVTALEGFGEQNPTLSTLAAIAEVLSCSVDVLLRPAPKPERRGPGRPKTTPRRKTAGA